MNERSAYTEICDERVLADVLLLQPLRAVWR